MIFTLLYSKTFFCFTSDVLIGELCGVRAVQFALPRKKRLIATEVVVTWR